MEKIVVVRREATPEAVCMAMDALSRKVLELGEETDRLRTENEWLRANAKRLHVEGGSGHVCGMQADKASGRVPERAGARAGGILRGLRRAGVRVGGAL